MPMQAFTNDTDHFLCVGLVTIAPGMTRDVDSALLQLPESAVSTSPELPAADPLLVLLDAAVAQVVAKLPELSTAELEQLGVMEQTGKARKGVLEPIAELILTRASHAAAQPAADANPPATLTPASGV